ITLTAVETEKEIGFNLEYCTKLFKRESIERVRDHFINILKEIAENPEKKISEIEMLTEEEKRKILVEFNDTKAEYPKDKTIYELFEEQVEKTPEIIAVVYEEKELSYRELNERANQLARMLRRRGVGPDKIVGIMVERSLEMIVGIMGILKAGGAYLPIDPEYPKERIEYMLEDSKVDILLTQTQLVGKSEFSGNIIEIDREDLYVGDSSNLEKINTSNNLAYVIYTSGTTGKPKGVMIEHRSVVNIMIDLQDKYPLLESDSYLLKTNYIFDVSVSEIFGWFLGNGKLVILKSQAEKDLEVIAETIINNQITHINYVPSMLNLFLMNTNKLNSLVSSNLKYIIIAGEAIQKKLVKELINLKSNISFENAYGPTEATIYATKYSLIDINEERNVPIGKPLSNTRIYIVNKNNKLQPVGVPGELCISGEGLARGYLNRPELIAEKFVSNPYESGERMYKTGDLARWLPDGNIEFIGRIDHQIKIRGFRIELGEIESQLLKHEDIKEAVVIDREDKEGNKYLCAYVVSDKEITVTELREHLSKELPDYMIPAYFMQLENIPLTPNGKIDRKALPEP
ncbi:MAG: amino acid adenylation domain-containing protein, partial [Bacillota bacterium]|nr:amino acid adenylation domain-containing protein [Bacillota bacterium]